MFTATTNSELVYPITGVSIFLLGSIEGEIGHTPIPSNCITAFVSLV